MLSRFARVAPMRRSARAFSDVITVKGKTEAEFLAEIRSIPDTDPDELAIIVPISDDAFELKPATDAELVDHLAEQALLRKNKENDDDEGFLHAIGLGPFHRRAALVVTGALTALSNEFYVLNEETFVAGCLFAGFTTMHVLLREPILDAYATYQKDILNAQNEAEDKHIAACQTLINSQKGTAVIAEAVEQVFAEKEELVHAETTARAIAERNRVAKEFDTRLQSMVNRKADEENKAYKQLIETVYDEVLSTAQTDAKFKKTALKYALTAISTPDKAGTNPTIDLYRSKLSK